MNTRLYINNYTDLVVSIHETINSSSYEILLKSTFNTTKKNTYVWQAVETRPFFYQYL